MQAGGKWVGVGGVLVYVFGVGRCWCRCRCKYAKAVFSGRPRHDREGESLGVDACVRGNAGWFKICRSVLVLVLMMAFLCSVG